MNLGRGYGAARECCTRWGRQVGGSCRLKFVRPGAGESAGVTNMKVRSWGPGIHRISSREQLLRDVYVGAIVEELTEVYLPAANVPRNPKRAT